jgi:hypothetical protein
MEAGSALGGRSPGSERFCFRYFYCPGCGTQIDVQIGLRTEPPLEAVEVFALDAAHRNCD